MEDTGSMEDSGEEEFREDTGEEEESMEDEDLGSSEQHTGSEGEDYVDPPPGVQQTDSVACSSGLANETGEIPASSETRSACVGLTDKGTEKLCEDLSLEQNDSLERTVTADQAPGRHIEAASVAPAVRRTNGIAKVPCVLLHASPGLSEVLQRMRFHGCNQKAGQAVSGFVAELRALASGCGFGDERDTLIRDRILCGVIDKPALLNALRDETQLTLRLVEGKALAAEKAESRPRRHAPRISIESEPDDHEDDRDYDHNEDGGSSSDDGVGGGGADKNAGGAESAARGHHYCSICDRSFRGAYKLARHGRTHTGEKPFRCADCGKAFGQTYHLRRHWRRAHARVDLYPCPDCAERFPTAAVLRAHRALHGLRRHACPRCETAFRSPADLEEHRKKRHGGEEEEEEEEEGEEEDGGGRGFICSDCGVSLKKACDLRRHMRTHREKPHRCPDCDLSFREEASLVDHRRRKHQKKKTTTTTGSEERAEEAPAATHPCSRCDRVFALRHLLERHQRESHGVEVAAAAAEKARRHQCHTCGKTFARFKVLKRHRLTHLRAHSLPCPHCDKVFSRLAALKAHQRLHHREERPHRCADCPDSFVALAELTAHQLGRHREKKPYPCTRCDESFSCLAELTSHLPVHQGGASGLPRLRPQLPHPQQVPAPPGAPPGGHPAHVQRVRQAHGVGRLAQGARAGARRRPAAPLRAVRPELRQQLQPQPPHAGARRRPGPPRLPGLRTHVQPRVGGPPAPDDAHGSETLRLPGLRQGVPQEVAPQHAHEEPHGRAALRLPGLREELHPERGQEPPREPVSSGFGGVRRLRG